MNPMADGSGSKGGSGTAGVQRPPLTSDRVRSVAFSDKLRGYNPDEVDDFLEEVAAGVDDLVARLQASPASPPAAVAPSAPPPRVDEERAFDEGTVARALILAQRTADLAIGEAEESARNLVGQAQARADTIVAEAEARAAEMTREARATAEAATSDLETQRLSIQRDLATLREQAQTEADTILREAKTAAAALTTQARTAADTALHDLERRRTGLQLEVAALRSRAAQHRDLLREMLSDHLLTLDELLSVDDDTPSEPQTGAVGAPDAGGVLPASTPADTLTVEDNPDRANRKTTGSTAPANGLAGSPG
jgi:DivIVA domain-containing protein